MISPCYCSQMRTAARRLGAVYDAALAPVGINIAQYSLLRIIEHLKEVSLTDLGRAAGLDRSTVGRNVRVLERDGLVATRKGKDQREAMVCLAARGVTVLKEAGPLWDGCQKQIEARLGPDNIAALRTIVTSM